MSLTKNQKSSVFYTMVISIVLCVAGLVSWLLFSSLPPAQAQPASPKPPVVNAQKYLRITTNSNTNPYGLTWNQKKNLKILLAVCLITGFFCGLGYFCFWACETSSIQQFCDGTTQYTVNQTNAAGTSMSWELDAPECR